VTLLAVRDQIIGCERCPRLRQYCARIAREKKAAYRDDDYWGRPVPGFGDPHARLLVVGLAPAAHGANRTGRPFTGDGRGGSGDFLMAAMHRHGFASLPTADRADDGLELRDAYIAMAARCAPPGNKPTREELAACQSHLEAEVAALPSILVVVALGKIAFDAWWRVAARWGAPTGPRPVFGHGLRGRSAGAPTVIASYHPSRQNTNTGRLTAEMLEEVFEDARRMVDDEVTR
jgi:uracil-DNA glycosylase family 4